MRTRLIILFSLLNIIVVGVGFYFLSQYLGDKLAADRQTVVVKSLDNVFGKPGKGKSSATQQPAAPTVVYKTNKFRWSQIETNDYRAYIANLRGIGCPEPTIRDIILTDVMRLYATQRGQLYQNGREFKFWETDEKRSLKQKQLEEREAQLAAIDKELPSVLRELLGINYERELNKYFVDTNEDDRRLSFLNEDKRAQVLALREDIERQRESILSTAQDGQLSPEDEAQLKKLDASRLEELARILSPEELQQYELTASETADRLRSELIGFNPTESEFREIYQRQKQFDAKYAYANLSDPAVLAARTDDESKMEEALKGSFGEARMKEYEKTKNADYRDLYVFQERFDWPASTVQTLMDIRRIAESESKKLLTDKTIPDERRGQALKAIQNETLSNLRQSLGDKVYSEYSHVAGDWVHELGTN